MSGQRIASLGLVLLGLVAMAPLARAKILKTKRPTQYIEYREVPLTVGSGFEYEGDSEDYQYDLPFLLEYGATDALTLTVEPDYVVVHTLESGTISGFGDLETSAVFEFVSERRKRPAIAAEVLIKWPTASSDSLTTGEIDYSVGGVISKEFVHFDVDSEWLYTFVGDPAGIDLKDATEISVAGNWHVSRSIDLELEAVTSSGGGFRGQGSSNLSNLPSDVEAEGRQWEGTVGLAEMLGHHLKLEQGVVIKSDGGWQAVAAWEWHFGEGD